jgi:hypothetical protein
MDIVEQAGTALAFPSQTLYLGQDAVPGAAASRAASSFLRA